MVAHEMDIFGVISEPYFAHTLVEWVILTRLWDLDCRTALSDLDYTCNDDQMCNLDDLGSTSGTSSTSQPKLDRKIQHAPLNSDAYY